MRSWQEAIPEPVDSRLQWETPSTLLVRNPLFSRCAGYAAADHARGGPWGARLESYLSLPKGGQTSSGTPGMSLGCVAGYRVHSLPLTSTTTPSLQLGQRYAETWMGPSCLIPTFPMPVNWTNTPQYGHSPLSGTLSIGPTSQFVAAAALL